MRPALIVVDSPPVRGFSNLGYIAKQVHVEHLFTVGAIEAFDVGILIRLARLDVVESHSLSLAPGGSHLGQILWAVIDTDRVRFAPPFHQPIQRTHHARAWDRGVDDNR